MQLLVGILVMDIRQAQCDGCNERRHVADLDTGGGQRVLLCRLCLEDAARRILATEEP